MNEKPIQRRKRSCRVKPEALLLLKKTMKEKGFTYSTQEQMYEELHEKTGRVISIDTVKNFFNPQFGRHPEKNTIQAIATTLGLMPEDLVEEWVSSGSKKKTSITKTEVCIEQSIFQKMLDKKIRELTANIFLNCNLETAKLYVPLGLIERKEKPKHREVTPENGSALYRANEYEISRQFENDQFLTEVLLEGNSPKSQGKRIAIIGEPGSGKSTRLQQIALWLIEQSPENYVIWISLADLQGHSLEDYLLKVWLKIALNTRETSEADQDQLVEIFNQGKVWLLLDGIDEMGLSENPLAWVNRQLCGWIDQAKIIVTCRINVWDGNRQALNQFDVYRNLDFSDDQRNEFIVKFLNNSELSDGLINELGQPSKERISDLVRNPLRLTLICRSWQKRQGALPDTKAGLYQECVEAYYDWKEEPKTTKAQRKELHKSLGKLAKQALDRDDFRFRLTEAHVSEILGESDESLFKLVLDLGWLNEVGLSEEKSEKIYAFFHPSFQEYFAALAIDEPEFLLNHILNDPQKGIYRILESQWLEVALLWIGRSDINNNLKDKLIDQLFSFDYCPESAYIYWIKTSIIATQLISEFTEAKNIENIIDYAVKNATGDWSEERGSLIHYQFEDSFREALSNSNHLYLLDKLNQNLEFLSQKIDIRHYQDEGVLWLAKFLLKKDMLNTFSIQIIENHRDFYPDYHYTEDDYYQAFGFRNHQHFMDEIKKNYGQDYNTPECWERYEKEMHKYLKPKKIPSLPPLSSELTKPSFQEEFLEQDDQKYESYTVEKLINDARWISENGLNNPVINEFFTQNPHCLFSSSELSSFLHQALGKNETLLKIIENEIVNFDTKEKYASWIINGFGYCLHDISNFLWQPGEERIDSDYRLIIKRVEYDYFCYKNPENRLSIDEYHEEKRKKSVKKAYVNLPANLCRIATNTSNIELFNMIAEFMIDLDNYHGLVNHDLMNSILSKLFEFDEKNIFISTKVTGYFANKFTYPEFYQRWVNHQSRHQLLDHPHLNRQASNPPF